MTYDEKIELELKTMALSEMEASLILISQENDRLRQAVSDAYARKSCGWYDHALDAWIQIDADSDRAQWWKIGSCIRQFFWGIILHEAQQVNRRLDEAADGVVSMGVASLEVIDELSAKVRSLEDQLACAREDADGWKRAAESQNKQ